MKVDDYDIADDLYYSKEHEWVKVEGDACRIGISDYAQKALHEIVYVDLPRKGMKVNQMQSIGTVESVKAVAEVFCPVSGEILEVNEKLSDAPELINKSPYVDGWIGRLRPANLDADLKALMNAKAYADYLVSLSQKKSG